MADLRNSSLDLQRIGGRDREDVPRASWDFRIYNQGPPCTLLTSRRGLKDWQTGQRRGEGDREKENSLSCPSCNNSSDGEVQNSICSALLYSQPCHLSKTIRTAEKTFRSVHTGPPVLLAGRKIMSWLPWATLQSLLCSALLCYSIRRETCSLNLQQLWKCQLNRSLTFLVTNVSNITSAMNVCRE